MVSQRLCIISWIFLVSTILLNGANSTCISDRKVNGCSVPLKGTFPYSTVFKPACNRHDVCYRCGSLFQWPRNDCDDGFLNDMLEICDEREVNRLKGLSVENPRYGLDMCRSAARTYQAGVRLFGFLFYRKNSPSWCSLMQCVQTNGQPNLS